jgi:hypothetical protein
MDGPYPIGKWDLKTVDGDKFGEWRGGGGHQSVFYGLHPDLDAAGQPIYYQIVVFKGPIRIRFA